jgi:molybdate transport system substrate-binding protein
MHEADMAKRCWMVIVVAVACVWPGTAYAQLKVLHSGGFAAPYREVLPTFEIESGLTVTSTLAASQGAGPDSIPSLLRKGGSVDVVIMSREGLDEVIREGRVIPETAVDLAQAPLAVAVRSGRPKPQISSVETFRQAVLRATSVNFVSTTGLYLTEKLFPALGISEEMARKANGSSLENLLSTNVDMVLRPVSEIANLSGFEYVGTVPKEIQFVSVFSAAIVKGSSHLDTAKRLIAFLSSEQVRAAARRSGMEPSAVPAK